MATATTQHPIGSGFGAESTAEEVSEGIDLSGRLAIVTGGYSGIGLETTRVLVERGAHVIVPARRRAAAAEALAGLDNVEIDDLDLGDQASVQAFAGRVIASGRSVDLLLCNAGIMACDETRIGPGWEAQFGTNHLGHYTLTNLLVPALLAGGGARVVELSSRGHKRSPIRFDDLMFAHGYDRWEAYGQAKTANSLFAVQLDALGRDSGIRAFAVHPGGILTPLQRYLPEGEMIRLGWQDAQGNWLATFKSVEQGAATTIWAATSPQLADAGGVYCEDCEIAELAVPGSPTAEQRGVNEYAVDPDQAARLWDVSAELTGVDAFA
jgi:NAD(P)-dependent dehydrogenase (short-subunit alcohol dehydrogenase family)